MSTDCVIEEINDEGIVDSNFKDANEEPMDIADLNKMDIDDLKETNEKENIEESRGDVTDGKGKPEKKEKGEGDDDSDSCSEDEFVVEKIIKKRIVDGKNEYYIKWKDWPSSTNTWEPEEHLHCPEKVEEFEAKYAAMKAAQANQRKKIKELSLPQSEIGYGFERGLEAEKILAATDTGGSLKFVMKWKDRVQPDVVLAAEANLKCPQIVIKFYEERLTWTPTDFPTRQEENISKTAVEINGTC